MGFNFSEDLKKVSISQNLEQPQLSLEDRIQKEQDPKYQNDKKIAAKQQNSILVQTILFDKGMKNLLNKIIDESKTKKTLSNYIFFVPLFAFLAFGIMNMTDSLFSSVATSLFNFFIVYVVYMWFFKSYIENYYYSRYVKKIKNFFDNKDDLFLSFLDSLINNNFIGSELPKDYGISPWNGKWLKELKSLFNNHNLDPLLLKFLEERNFNVSRESNYWELNTLLHKYYKTKSDKDLVIFLKKVIPQLDKEIQEGVFKVFDNKQELYHTITSKVGKNN